MDGAYQVAQATHTGTGNSSAKPRIYKLTKPLADQAVTVNLGYDQKVQVDFSAIANEKITLVHIREKLVILFDNSSTLTIEPFFDSRHDPLANLPLDNITIEMAPGKEFSVTEFTQQFPISTDASVLPATDLAGVNANANAQATGAHFEPATVDPLALPNPLPLLPQEELPNFTVELPTGTNQGAPTAPTVPSAPEIVAGISPAFAVDESFIPVIGSQVAVPGSPTSNIDAESITASFTVNAPAGVQSITYVLTVPGATATTGVDSGLIDSVTGNHVFLFLQGGEVVAREGTNATSAAGGEIDFTLAIDASGKVTLTDLRGVHEGSGGETPDASEGISLASGLVSVTATVTDNNNNTATASIDVGHQLTIHDDGPSITAVGVGPALNVDESFIPVIGSGTGAPGSATDTESFAGAFTHVNGADGATISYALSVSAAGVDSGLIDAVSGNHIFLFVNGSGVVEGREGTTSATAASGPIDFTLAVDASGNVTAVVDRGVHQGSVDTGDISEGVTLAAGLVTLTATITDGDGDHQAASIDVGHQLTIHDDGPVAPTVTASTATVGVDETPGLQTTAGASDVAGSTTVTFNGASTTVAALFASVANPGTDPDVPSGSLDNGALSFASTGASSILSVGTLTYGADGPAAANPETIALTVTNANSGLTLTDGTAITLSLDGSGRVIGTVGTDVANPSLTGETAFVIAIDQLTGKVYVADYLSLHQDSASNTPNDLLSLAAGSVGVTVTLTDGDGDHVTSTTTDISSHVGFLDDGPSIGAIQNAIMPNAVNTDAHGTWQPVFGADGLAAASAIGITIPSGTINGLTYTVTDTGTHNPAGEEVFSVNVTGGSAPYTFYEYVHYDPTAKAAEMFAYIDQADANLASGTNEFFTLSMAANGTYDFHLVSNTFQVTEVFDLTAQKSGEGEFFQINGTTGAYGNGAIPTTGFDLLIDGWNAADTNPAHHTMHGNANGFGVDNGNLDVNETVFFKAGADQTAMSVGIGKGGNATTEHFLVSLVDSTGTVFATENITLPDGQTVVIDAAHWGVGGTTTGTFGTFRGVEVENIASAAGDDPKVNLTNVTFNEHEVVSSTALNFDPVITDGDGDSVTSSTNLNVSLLGTFATVAGTSASEVIVASATTAMTITGGGGVDIADFSNDTTTAVVASLATGSATGSWVGTDTLSGITGLIGSAHGSDTLTASSAGSTLVAFGANDTLNGGTGNDTLIAGAELNTTMHDTSGSNKYEFNETTPTTLGDTIFNVSGTDGIFVDVASQNLTFQNASTISAAQYATGADHAAAGAWNGAANSFFVETSGAGSNLWYSDNGTLAHAVEIAHIATGVPSQGQIHTA